MKSYGEVYNSKFTNGSKGSDKKSEIRMATLKSRT